MKQSPKIIVRDLSYHYGNKQVLKHLNLEVEDRRITAVTGPSGEGKSSFLMVLNRLFESVPGSRVTGSVLMRFAGDYTEIMFPALSASELRRKVGMVFQQPNPLPMSIAKNMIFPLKLRGRVDRQTAEFLMEANLKRVGLWDEVKDRLSDDARRLSGGQQQRLCLARALMLEPEILLLDEPTSSLDEPAAHAIEDLLLALKEQCTIVLVSHYLAQVHRIAGRVFRLENHQFREITRY